MPNPKIGAKVGAKTGAKAESRSKGNVRLAAARTLLAVCDHDQSLDHAMAAHIDGIAKEERSLYKALCYGAVRWAPRYHHALKARLKKPFKSKERIVQHLLVLALFELDHMRNADHAVVNETVKLTTALNKGWAKNLVNAILRGHLRERGDAPSDLTDAQLKHCYPAWLVKQIAADWPGYQDAILRASLDHPPMTLRINLARQSRESYTQGLAASEIATTPCKDSPFGFSLNKPIEVNQVPGFDAGLVSVQDESAQLCAPLLNLQAEQRVLDACAAPGGKSGHLLELEPRLELTVVDFAHRLDRLQANMQRLIFCPTVVKLDPEAPFDQSWWDGRAFDRILLDVPCTGTGVMRRHPDIKLRRSPENSLQFAQQQSTLLSQCWAMLKTKGQLLYTTCSIFSLENDQRIDLFCAGREDVSICALPESLGLKTRFGRQRLPGVHAGDGFYYALLKKK